MVDSSESEFVDTPDTPEKINKIISEISELHTRSPRSRGARDTEPNDDILNAQFIPKADFTHINGTLIGSDTKDWYRTTLTKGDNSGNYAEQVVFVLGDVSTGSGVKMALYGNKSRPPYPHLLAITRVHDAVKSDPNVSAAVITLVAPVDGEYYLKVMPNGIGKGNYSLDIARIVLNNSGYDKDNTFPDSNWVDATQGAYFPSIYLDPIYDIHDFYNFTGYENQSLQITVGLTTTADYDIFLFDRQTTRYIASSETINYGGEENIDVQLSKTGEYYLRVWARVNGTVNQDNNYGTYSLDIRGNVPPMWLPETQKVYYMNEDDDPIYIEGETLWNDINNDNIEHMLWNPAMYDWEPNKENAPLILSTVDYEFFKIQIQNNGTISLPDIAYKITPHENKFGTASVRVGARDSDEGFAANNITIVILPINDKPVINSTLKWGRFLPDPLTVKKNRIVVQENNQVEIKAVAFDIDGDNLTFSDNTDLFAIDPKSGLISFYAEYHLIGPHKINISVTDDGKNPDQLTFTLPITIIIEDSGIDRRPRTHLLTPENTSIIKSLVPTLSWNASDYDSDLDQITFSLYFSTSRDHVISLSNEALILSGTNKTKFSFQDPPLLDETTYFWTVIPHDEIFRGYCVNGYFKLKTSTSIEAPEVTLISPENNSILNYTDVELKWSIKYSDQEAVKSDIYFGITESELILLEQDFKGFSYFPDRLGFHTYYWKIVPKAGIPPSRITGDESEVATFSIQKGYKPPEVILISPEHTSIFKIYEVSLSWRVEYKNPNAVDYKVFISESEKLDTPFDTVSNTFLKYTAPKSTKYFWKIVPYVKNVPGPASETRWFTIDPTVVQPIVIPKYPKDNSTINITWVELLWTVDYSGSIAKIRYDIFLDNNTDYRPGMEQIRNNYRQLFIGVELDDNKTYYWYVLPSIETEKGIIVGEFQNLISSFTVDTNYKPPPEPEFELTIDPAYILIPVGNKSNIEIVLINTGNVDLTIDLSYKEDPSELLFVDLKTKKLLLPKGSRRTLILEVTTPTNAAPNTGITVTVQALADEVGLVDREVLTIELKSTIDTTPKTGNGENGKYLYIGLAIVIIIIVLLMIAMFVTKKRKKAEEPISSASDMESIADSSDRVSLPSTSPYTSPAPEASGYQPPSTDTTSEVPQAATGTAVTTEEKPKKIIKPVMPIKPVKPITPIKPVKSVTPSKATKAATVAIKPITPVSPVTTKSKPADSKDITSEPVKPLTPVVSKSEVAESESGKPVEPKPVAVKPVTPITTKPDTVEAETIDKKSEPVKPVTTPVATSSKPVVAAPVTPLRAKAVKPVAGVKPVNAQPVKPITSNSSKPTQAKPAKPVTPIPSTKPEPVKPEKKK
jgi:hypothetical protein